jgi:hypothetical protein
MSEPERSARNFLRRWSRRKRAAQVGADERATLRKDEPRGAEENSHSASGSEAELPVFDPAALPPIESITGIGDVRAFLAPGVPEELTRAALRRVWTTDPTIRDFVGIAENQGDFTAPDGVLGFGSLPFTPELREMVAALIGDAPVIRHSQPPASSAADGSTTREVHRVSADAPSDNCAAMPMSDAAADDVVSQEIGLSAPNANRRHGGAVPK